MRILQKKGDLLELICVPSELVFEIGDYLRVSQDGKSILVQVIDVSYPELPGTVEDLLRDMVLQEVDGRRLLDVYNTDSVSMMLKDTRLVLTKLRVVLEDEVVRHNSSWVPSRYTATVEKASNDFLKKITCRLDGELMFEVGSVGDEPFTLPLAGLDGCLTIITGKKESGKSHLAKILVESLASNGATVLVLDVNGEYVNLDKTTEGRRSRIADSVCVLEPGSSFKASLRRMGLKTFLDILEHVYGTPPTSLREVARVWKRAEKRGEVSLEGLMELVEREDINEAVRDALLSRLQSIKSSGFFDEENHLDLEEAMSSKPEGNVAVVDLSKLLPSVRRLVVEYLLSHLSSLLSVNKLDPIFLLAEEAHLYLRETYWEDIVTRMRHIGLFPIIVTNQPDTVPELVYRQADNIFLFNFTNDSDLEKIARVSKVDAETVRTLVKKMPPRYCLVMGRVVSDIPLMVKVRPSSLMTMGATKLFFRNPDLRRKRVEKRTAFETIRSV
ncbi:MAG: DUF87 domain-containing protein [Candidatus Caldarchaeum sp.]|nr:DUF87 domain-containing protein [Candidatus Caldarchaeum sp.]